MGEGGHITVGDLFRHGMCASYQSCAGVHDGVLAAQVSKHHGFQNVAGHAPPTAKEEHRAFLERAYEGGRSGDGCHVWNLMNAGARGAQFDAAPESAHLVLPTAARLNHLLKERSIASYVF